MPEGRILLIVSSLLANSILPSSILLVFFCLCVVQALIKEFLFYLWCKNVVCTVFLSDAKDKMDSSHALHTNNIFSNYYNHHQNEKVRKKPIT